MRCFATLGTTLFAGTDGGVFKSTDNGATWSSSSNGIARPLVFSLTVIGIDIFAGTKYGLFRSSDNGLTWTEPNKEFATGVSKMVVVGDYLFVDAVGDGSFGFYGLYRSNDRGLTWIKVDTFSWGGSFAEMGGDLYASSSTFGNYQVYRTSDKGYSWERTARAGLPENKPLNHMVSKGSDLLGVVYESDSDNKLSKVSLFKSIDKSENWTLVSTGLPVAYLYTLAVEGNNLFVSSEKGVYRSTDNGVSWVSANTGLSKVSVYTLGIAGDNLLAGTNGGVFNTTNNGTSWVSSSTGLRAAIVSSIVKKGSDLFAGVSTDASVNEERIKGGLFISSNNGVTWSERITGLTNTDVTSLVAVGNDLFAGTHRGGVFYSADNGSNWTDVNNGINADEVVVNLLSDGNKIFANTYGGVFYSTNKGQSWIRIARSFFSLHSAKGVFFGNDERGDGVYRSVDSGVNWTKVESNIRYLYDVEAIGSDLYAFGDKGFYLSTNAGITWTVVEGNLPKAYGRDNIGYSLAVNGNNLFAGTLGGSVFVSNDFGKNWKAINEGVPPNFIGYSLLATETSLLASFYGRGLWERPLAELAPPAMPIASAASSINSTGFIANWAAASGAISYQLDVSKDNFVTFVDGYNSKTVTGTSQVVTGLTSTTTYQYRVRAVNELGISGNSTSISATTLIQPPSAPTALAATAISPTGFTANWAAVSSATGYQLDISKDNFALLWKAIIQNLLAAPHKQFQA